MLVGDPLGKGSLASAGFFRPDPVDLSEMGLALEARRNGTLPVEQVYLHFWLLGCLVRQDIFAPLTAAAVSSTHVFVHVVEDIFD